MIVATMMVPFFSVLFFVVDASAWTPHPAGAARPRPTTRASTTTTSSSLSLSGFSSQTSNDVQSSSSSIAGGDANFDDFVEFLRKKQDEIIQQLEDMEAEAASSSSSSAKFSRDPWGLFEEGDGNGNGESSSGSSNTNSGGITRVLQGGGVIEKGACSLTLIRQGILTADRASTIRARQRQEGDDNENNENGFDIHAGDSYAAAALSMVLHSKSPMVPTFRSDVRIFLVQKSSATAAATDSKMSSQSMAWLGGGADLTPYYLFEEDVQFFHECYRDLCNAHFNNNNNAFTYQSMKKACDDYFYLPARREHRGTGGIFFDDMELNDDSLAFCKGVVNTWMPSWLPIVAKRKHTVFSQQEKQWQLLRRGRYLEFNLLYDRGVKFGLANANPRVEGVMVSAPPVIAYEYNHAVQEGSNEAALVKVLKQPREWVK